MGGDWAIYLTRSSVKKVGVQGDRSALVKYGNWDTTYTFKTYDAIKPDSVPATGSYQTAYAGELYELKSHPGCGLRLDAYNATSYTIKKVPLA